jgi:hypothetical protein
MSKRKTNTTSRRPLSIIDKRASTGSAVQASNCKVVRLPHLAPLYCCQGRFLRYLPTGKWSNPSRGLELVGQVFGSVCGLLHDGKDCMWHSSRAKLGGFFCWTGRPRDNMSDGCGTTTARLHGYCDSCGDGMMCCSVGLLLQVLCM